MTDNNTSGQVQFIASHQPALEDGDYTITVQQRIQIPGNDQTFVLKQEQKFSVLGPRFTLDPQEIQAVFPPPGSLGEHSNVLPHIILKRSTLPWERSATAADGVPWLALLLFDEGDIPNKTNDSDEIKAKNKALLDQIKTPNSWMLKEVQAATTVDLPKSSETKTTYTVGFPIVGLESGDHPEDVVAVIDVPKSLLSQILPSTDELKLLAHVRQTSDAAGVAQGDEVAVIICNRLPKSGSMSIVHLVSLEGRYNSVFDFERAEDEDLIRLVSLYSWRFACVSEKHSFKGLLMHLNHPLLFNVKAENNSNDLSRKKISDEIQQAFEQIGQPLGDNAQVAECEQWHISSGNTYFIVSETCKVYSFSGTYLFTLEPKARPSDSFTKPQKVPQSIRDSFSSHSYPLAEKETIVEATDHWWITTDRPNIQYVISQEAKTLYVHHLDLDSSSTLRLPGVLNEDGSINGTAEPYFAMGCVPLAHDMRQGNRSVSWYHGPLVPGSMTNHVNLPIRSADELILYSQAIGMFDVSYSAAWELGRLLTLQNKRASVDLFNWKRSHAQSIKDAEGRLDHLPFDTPTALELPESVRTWFENLALLKGLPFDYLVPDERMLPTESIRFFQVDSSWVECMLDGAFSIGRVLATDHGRDGDLSAHLPGEKQMSGFLLRSDIVAGWPGLLIDGYRIVKQPDMQFIVDTLNNLEGKPVSADLQKYFAKQGLTLLSGSQVMVIRKGAHWSLNDSQSKSSYKVTVEDDQLLIKLHTLRRDYLSKNVLICIFEGAIQAVDIHLKPETLHFGVSEEDDGKWGKKKRKEDGDELPGDPTIVPFRNNSNAERIIDVLTLCDSEHLGTSTAAELALQMIEGVEKVRFVQKTA